MNINQSFFFSDGRIRYWENLERETASSLGTLLTRRLANGVWHAAEGWMHDELVCRVERSLAGPCGSSDDEPSMQIDEQEQEVVRQTEV